MRRGCNCNEQIELTSSSVTHVIFGNSVTIHGAVQFICSECGHGEYQEREAVDRVLRQAYLDGKSEVLFPGNPFPATGNGNSQQHV